MIITKKIRTLIKIEKYTEYKRLKSQTKHFMTKIIITIIIKNPPGPWSGLTLFLNFLFFLSQNFPVERRKENQVDPNGI